MSIFPDWLVETSGVAEKYPAYISAVTFAKAVAVIGGVNARAATTVAAISDMVTIATTRAVAVIVNVSIPPGRYPATIGAVSHGTVGVAGISNITV